MTALDWTQRDCIIILAGSGLLLIVLSLLIRYGSEKRGNFLTLALGIVGGLVLGTAGGLYYLPPLPDWFSDAAAWYTVVRRDIVLTAVEPGWVVPLDATDVRCKVHGRIPGQAVTYVRWVIDEGKRVKKGELLAELEDSEWRKQLKEQKLTPQGRQFLEEQIANCRILAPRDGIAIYYIPEFQRWAGPWLGQGEPLKEGQKMITIYDPAKMGVRTHISSAQIARLKVGQAARIHIDAFPDRAFLGQVSSITNMPTRADTGPRGAAYEVEIKLSDPIAGLLPDMRAKVSIELARLDNVLSVPTEAILHSGKKSHCFVKSDRQIEIRLVHVGLSDSQFTVVDDGLREGEQVLGEVTWQRLSVNPNKR